MPPKAKLPAPIDRPLSRAYLREFSGWSTAYPPGLSEPTSLRVMENAMVNRDGSLRVRPGLKYLSYVADTVLALPAARKMVGSHEVFFLNDGTKAYLFAVREDDGSVGFRAAKYVGGARPFQTYNIDNVAIGFPVGSATTAKFSSATSYVKYLQIDNKIIALSDAGETMRIFHVGSSKRVVRPSSLERPLFDVADKLTVVHPDSAWVTNNAPAGVRTNLAPNPSFEAGINGATAVSSYTTVSQTTGGKSGTKALYFTSLHERENLMRYPLGNVGLYGTTGWGVGSNTWTITQGGANTMRFTSSSGIGSNAKFYANGTTLLSGITPGQRYNIAWDYANAASVKEVGAMIRWYNGSTQIGADQSYQILNPGSAAGRKVWAVTAPANANRMQLFFYGVTSSTTNGWVEVRSVLMAKDGEPTSYFDGDSGTGYLWVGTAGDDPSRYHPDRTLTVTLPGGSGEGGKTYTAAVQYKCPVNTVSVELKMEFLNSSGAQLGISASGSLNVAPADGWQRRTVTAAAPAGTTQILLHLIGYNVPRGLSVMVDEVLVENVGSAGGFFDGDTASTSTLQHAWTGTPQLSPSTATTSNVALTVPPAETPAANTLVGSAGSENVFNFGYFYTIANEIGESAASQISTIKVKRRLDAWKWETPNAAGEPSSNPTQNPAVAADQLVSTLPQAVYDVAKANGATHWNLYVMVWTDQDVVPVEGLLVASKAITAGGTRDTEGWIAHTPQPIDGTSSAPIPTSANRVNYSNPAGAAQGVVAADRMVLVNDPSAGAVIRWTSNRIGEYTNFTASKGGGYKTLTSGNLYVPATVKLWQNPESKDTLTILCLGVDGYSTAYYMAPSQVASQSDAVNVMGFEETTATPGTTSPYGCEVLNNALYHPLDDQLMKSTASNYNISHKSMTEPVSNLWKALANKAKIVSSQHDNRLYFLVHNPEESLPAGCWGNELWVCDTAPEGGTWSRWLIPGISLRKIDVDGRVMMSVVQPDGIFALDEDLAYDEVVDPVARTVSQRAIPWRIETNTQGANRAHDAWAHLQQVGVVLGSFLGQMRYGVKGIDLHGKPVDASKIVRDDGGASTDGLPWDLEDQLRVARDMKEWHFYAGSVEDDLGETLLSAGQISLVQYRYTPVSVNVGYEHGSIETFEYTRNATVGNNALTFNGVPVGANDTRRP